MTKNSITLDELCGIVNGCAGVALDAADLSMERGVNFTDVGVDSLGVLGAITELELLLGIALDDSEVKFQAAGELLHAVYSQLVADGRIPVGHTESAIVIDAPLDLVWELTNDVPNWPILFSEYAEATVLKQEGDTVTFRLTMHPDENDTRWSWVSERTSDQATGKVVAHRVETGPFEFMDINWSYREVDGGVELAWQQDFALKPTAPVDTAFMTAQISANSAIQLARIRAVVEKAAAGAIQTVAVAAG